MPKPIFLVGGGGGWGGGEGMDKINNQYFQFVGYWGQGKKKMSRSQCWGKKVLEWIILKQDVKLITFTDGYTIFKIAFATI